MDYYDPDKIFADEEKLKIKIPFEIETFGFYLNPGLNTLRKDSKVEMPFFLIKFLLENEKCELIENPFDEVRNDLEAEASIVDLKNKHFYTINKTINDPLYLNSVFFERMGAFVFLLIKNTFCEDDLSKMSFEEKKIITHARRSFTEFQNYFYNKL